LSARKQVKCTDRAFASGAEGERSSSVAGDVGPDMAVRCRHDAEPAESFPGQTTKTAESTTFTVLRLSAAN